MENCKKSNITQWRLPNQLIISVDYVYLFLSLLLGLGIISKVNASDDLLELEVIDPYIELQSGPAVGYPIFYTIEQGETIIVLTRRAGWYELQAENGRTGWARASQVARTLLPTGEPVDLPSVSYGDYLINSWRVGFNMGQFSDGELSGSDTFSYSIGYRPLSWAGIEAEFGKFYDTEIRGNYQSLNLLIEPLSEWKLSPVLHLGGGTFKMESQPELTPLDLDNSSFKTYGLSVNYYIGRNFVIHSGFQNYTLSTHTDDERLKRWNIGFNAFF